MMTSREFLSRLRRALGTCVEGADVVDACSWNGFVQGLDSIQFIEIVIAIEEEFGVRVPDSDLSFDAVGDYNVLRNVITGLVDSTSGGD